MNGISIWHTNVLYMNVLDMNVLHANVLDMNVLRTNTLHIWNTGIAVLHLGKSRGALL